MTREKTREVFSGWPMLVLSILVWLAIPGLSVWWAYLADAHVGIVPLAVLLALIMLLVPTAFLLPWGLFTLQPNEARVLVLFGEYRGTVRKDGFHWANPFSVHRVSPTAVARYEPSKQGQVQFVRPPNRYRISLRARNFETQALKVNDQRGNPIEIAAVVVWRVQDTAQALFDVDDYADYIKVQSETAVRHLANCHPYDHGGDEVTGEITLRDGTDTVSAALREELQARLEKAGVVVEEARLTHLAYAPEIAGAMLRRQQAEAIIAARQKIVQGAVSMVEMALASLSERRVVELDEERKAAMVSNLLVVLCGEREASPVINTGTLYH